MAESKWMARGPYSVAGHEEGFSTATLEEEEVNQDKSSTRQYLIWLADDHRAISYLAHHGLSTLLKLIVFNLRVFLPNLGDPPTPRLSTLIHHKVDNLPFIFKTFPYAGLGLG